MEMTVLTREQQEFSRRLVIGGIAAIVMLYVGWRVANEHAGTVGSAHAVATHAAATSHATAFDAIGSAPPAIYAVIPFATLLCAIAVLPLLQTTEAWWERNWNRFLVAAALGTVTLMYYAFFYGHGVVDHTTHQLSHPGWPAAATVLKNALLVEYVPFIVLLFSLYVISGGIAFEGNFIGRPTFNTGIIAAGGLLASFIGTTGAAMLLIRPLLKANARRNYVAHTVVFFIFVACNTGGCLLPIGDPPLYLGFLRGVSFAWTLGLWPMWLSMNLALLAIYFVWDSLRSRRENPSALMQPSANIEQRFALRGAANFLWLGGVIACVVALDPSKPLPGSDWHAPPFFRELAMLGFAAMSLWSTDPELRRKNAFNYDAILEVAALFVGIFICMQVPVQLLNFHGPSLGIDEAWKFYWATGILSSFLDNAPTYVVFFETARTLDADGARVAGVLTAHLMAISLGAVFMGAMTYIGNGPNFMVKAIAEAHNVRMPSFFGYMVYSCSILLPLSLLVTWLFL